MTDVQGNHGTDIPKRKSSGGPIWRVFVVGSSIAGLLACGLLATLAFVVNRKPQSGYSTRLVSEIDLPATKSFLAGTDYATVHNDTLFVSYSSANALIAIDTRTNTVRTFATALPGVHGVAFADKLGLAFVSLGKAKGVAVLEMPTGRLKHIAPAGDNPDGIVFDQNADVAYAGNGRSDSATLIAATDLAHSFSVPLGGSPEYPQVDESTGLIYQPLEDTSEVVVIDPRMRRLLSRFNIAPCKNPTGSALDPDHGVLFVGCSNRMLAVMDLRDGHLVTTLPIGRFVDVVAFDAGLHRVYTANSAGSMTVIQQSPQGVYSVLDTVGTRAGGHTLAVDLKTHRIYVVCSGIRARVIVYEPIPNPSSPLR